LNIKILEFARDGNSLEEILSKGKQILGRKLVLDGVEQLLKSLTLEVNLNNKGQTQITISKPICTEDGDMQLIFYGSFLPVPSYDIFNSTDGYVLVDGETTEYPGKLMTYQVFDNSRQGTANEEGELIEDENSKMQTNEPIETNLVEQELMIKLNKDKKECILVRVTNTSDRTINVGSHFNFIEANKMLEFDRATTYGMRLVRIKIYLMFLINLNIQNLYILEYSIRRFCMF